MAKRTRRQTITRFGLGDAIQVLSKPHQLIHYINDAYRLWDDETHEDYGYITHKDFKYLSTTEVKRNDCYRNEAFYRF